MNRRDINLHIFLTGNRHKGYEVTNNMPGCSIVCYVPTTKIGNAIVRALRELAYKDNQK